MPSPSDPDVAAFVVRVGAADEVVLWGFLLGEEGLAFVQGERAQPGRVVLLTPRGRAEALRGWLHDVALELPSLRIESAP